MNDASLAAQHTKSRQLYWICQTLGWGVYTVTRIVGAVTVFGLPWIKVTLELLSLSAVGLGLSHGLRNYVQRHHWNTLSIPQLTKRIVVAGIVLGTPLGIITQLTDVAALQDLGPILRAYAPGLN